MDLHPATKLDLHVHSTRSDGRYDVDQVLVRAARGGLDVVAITDHDLGTLDPGPRTIEGHKIHLLAGAEISGLFEGREYHLLVYFPGTIPQGFQDFCTEQCLQRAERYRVAVQRLALPGLAGPRDEALAGQVAVTRLHLARALVAGGHVASPAEAFARFLGAQHGIVDPLETSLVHALGVARRFGGLTSWAHPPLLAVERHLSALVAAGLQGLEALRPTVSGPNRRVLRRAARRHGLYLTGGSDWHGWGADNDLGLFRVQAREIGDFVDAVRAA